MAAIAAEPDFATMPSADLHNGLRALETARAHRETLYAAENEAKARLRDMAEGLIALAAKRSLRTSEAITPPQGLFDEFCARFPYEETDDQLNAIGDVL